MTVRFDIVPHMYTQKYVTVRGDFGTHTHNKCDRKGWYCSSLTQKCECEEWYCALLTENVSVRSDVVPYSHQNVTIYEEWYCAILTENVTVRSDVLFLIHKINVNVRSGSVACSQKM